MSVKNNYSYHSYLLRLWQEDLDTPWRATLQDPHTGERHTFSELPRLIAFLEAQTDTQSAKQNKQDEHRNFGGT